MDARLDDPGVRTLDPLMDDLTRGPMVVHGQGLPTVDPSTPIEVPTGALLKAMGAWLIGVFALCWIALPLLAVLTTGLHVNLLLSGLVGAPIFALAAFAASMGAASARPRMRLDMAAPRDPVLSAMAGGLLSWAVVHNLVPIFIPFAAMSGLEVAVLVGINVVEMALLGVLFASFTRRRTTAFALGAGFQALIGGLALSLYSL